MPPKHIAIVGYGSATLSLLKTLQDLPRELREGWRVTVFERREALGGQWLPDEDPASGVALTGLYPDLRTNTPVHMMTYPHTPFPDETDLFPHWKVILKYLQGYAQKWGLYSSDPEDWNRQPDPTINGHAHQADVSLKPSNTPADEARRQLPRRILCNRELYSAKWVGSTKAGEGGRWKVISKAFPPSPPSSAGDQEETFEDDFDAIIDATGHLVHPAIPTFRGQEEWLAAQTGRKIMHSAFYRGPKAFKDQTVLVVGAGPSGLDGSLQIGRTAKKVYHAVTPTVILPPKWPYERRARLSHFTADAAVFSDGSEVSDIDTVYLGTGFIIRYEYLERGGMLQRRPGKPLPRIEEEAFPGLVSTDYYVRPLFEHTASFAANHGPASLFWCGNIMSTSYRFSNAVQSALIAWLLAKPDILPARDELYRLLKEDEARTLALNRVVEKVGHRQGPPHAGESEVYQRRIIAFLASHGISAGSSIDKTGFIIELWREEVRVQFWRCMRGWNRLEKEGRTKELLKGVSGEEGYAKLSRFVIEEQTRIEKNNNRHPMELEISGWEE